MFRVVFRIMLAVTYSYLSLNGLNTSVSEEGAYFFLLSFTCNYVVSFPGIFLFLLVLRYFIVALLGLPCNHLNET